VKPDSKVTFVTGASKGIGRFLAGHYVSQGHQVIGCSRTSAAWEDENYRHFEVDVTDEEGIRRVFSAIQKDYGRLDHLINNAGMASMNHSLLTPMSSVRKVLSTNLESVFLVSREGAKLMMRRKWGRIVNFCTVAVPLRVEGEAAYVASKAGVLSLTQVMARELAPFGVTVNAVGPGPVDTDLIRGVPPEKIQNLVDRQAIRRKGEFGDIANVVDFFLRPDSDFITGQVLFLGGV
jgi:3-oxoacyl-[acyl-carrier protein] reductase